MKPIQDCEFTAFISYAHADDEAWFDWITHFRNELERGLGALLRGVKLPRMHLSDQNGPIAGLLGEELQKRVAASFAMIIVVHDNYAQSQWCLRELEYFKSLFGEEGLRQRLYIVALSESAIQSVTGGSAWQRMLPGQEQLWMPFFDAADRNRPLDIYMGPGLVSPGFRAPFERLRGDLAAKLKASVAQAAAQATTRTVAAESADLLPRGLSFTDDKTLQGAPGSPVASAPSTASSRTVLMGFSPAACAAAAASAVAELARAGLVARQLSQDVVFSEFADFDAATDLVLPVDDHPLMLTAVSPGGHLQLQRDAWLKKGRPADGLHWLDLRPQPAGSAQGSAAAVQGLGGQAVPVAELLRRLNPQAGAVPTPAPPQAVRIYIESNRHERTLWEPLGEQIRLRWDQLCAQLAPARVPPLSLRARGLPVDQIDAFPSLDDADGVVLLWGRKTSEALVAQINKVENKLSPGRDAAPGIVAYLMPPQAASEPIPAWGWQVLRFNAADEQSIDVVDDERDELTRFLHKVFRRRQQRDEAASPAP